MLRAIADGEDDHEKLGKLRQTNAKAKKGNT